MANNNENKTDKKLKNEDLYKELDIKNMKNVTFKFENKHINPEIKTQSTLPASKSNRVKFKPNNTSTLPPTTVRYTPLNDAKTSVNSIRTNDELATTKLKTPNTTNTTKDSKSVDTSAASDVVTKADEAASNTVTKKRLESMTDDEIIEQNLREIFENKSREERKANGRLIAVLVASLVIFLGVYHAWIRKTAALASVLVPAGIMLGYGGWVVILAKRDKRKRAMFEKHVEEVTLKNKAQLEEKNKLKHTKGDKGKGEAISALSMLAATAITTTLNFENELSTDKKQTTSATLHMQPKDPQQKPPASTFIKPQIQINGNVQPEVDEHEAQKNTNNNQLKQVNTIITVHDPDGKEIYSRDNTLNSRQKLFRQNATTILASDLESKLTQAATTKAIDVEAGDKSKIAAILAKPTSPENNLVFLLQETKKKRKKLQRLDALPTPHVIRMNSAPECL